MANYDSLATDGKQRLNSLADIWQGSVLKTWAPKHPTSVDTMAKTLKPGRDDVYRSSVNGGARHLKRYALKDLKNPPKTWTVVDTQPNVARYVSGRTDIVQRLHAQKGAYCGTEEGHLEVPQVRTLKDLHGKEHWQQVMAARRSKTLVVCNVCHDLLHKGTLPAWRSQGMERRAGCHESGKSGSGGG